MGTDAEGDHAIRWGGRCEGHVGLGDPDRQLRAVQHDGLDVPGHTAGPVAASGAPKILARAWASSSCVNAPNSLWWRSSSSTSSWCWIWRATASATYPETLSVI